MTTSQDVAIGGGGFSPAWSPDGTEIAFTLNTISDEFQHVPNTLAVINADGDFRRGVTWVP